MQFSIDERPRDLEKILGQSTITRDLLKRQLNLKWPKAMLMQGIHGTGKTTTAMIVAMAIQCSNSSDVGAPCGTCGSCRSIIEERWDRDTHMLDGALLSTKDNVKEKLDLVNITPMQDPKRVYIIEEANQLSGGAINAFHKILESPNKNVHFILLTMTDVGKPIPVSIKSRCQIYNFKPFTVSDTMKALKDLMVKEDLWEDDKIPNSFRMEGLALIANASRGSFRDAVQYFERCIGGKFFSADDIRNNLDIVDESSVIKLVKGFLEKDESVWFDINQLDPMELYSLGMTVVTNAMIYKTTGVILNETYGEQTKQIASHKNIEGLYNAFKELGGERTFLRRSELQGIFIKYWSESPTEIQYWKKEGNPEIPKKIPVRTRRIEK